MYERIRQVIVKEFIQMTRDYRMRMVMFVMPVIQVLVFGFAASTDVRLVKTAVYDQDNTPASRELVRRFSFSGYFSIREWISSEGRLSRAIDAGSVSTVIRLDKGFERRLLQGVPAPVQLIVDGTDSNTAGIILNYAADIVQGFSGRLPSVRRSIPGVELRHRAWFNANLESRIYLVPGVVALVLLTVTMLLTSMSIVREKERGTMEQLIVSPIRPFELILGKLFPYAVVGIFDVIAVTAVAVIVFKVPLRGSILLLLAASGLFILTSLGLGLFVSTISRTLQEAQMTMFFFAQPITLLSGFMFPVANMPAPVQWMNVINPLQYYIVIVRGLFLKGAGFGILWPDMLALLLIGLGVIVLSSSVFRKTLA